MRTWGIIATERTIKVKKRIFITNMRERSYSLVTIIAIRFKI